MKANIDLQRTVIIRGAPFSFRTLHAPDARRAIVAPLQEYTLDRLITVTLAAVAGLHHHECATVEVTL